MKTEWRKALAAGDWDTVIGLAHRAGITRKKMLQYVSDVGGLSGLSPAHWDYIQGARGAVDDPVGRVLAARSGEEFIRAVREWVVDVPLLSAMVTGFEWEDWESSSSAGSGIFVTRVGDSWRAMPVQTDHPTREAAKDHLDQWGRELAEAIL